MSSRLVDAIENERENERENESKAELEGVNFVRL